MSTIWNCCETMSMVRRLCLFRLELTEAEMAMERSCGNPKTKARAPLFLGRVRVKPAEEDAAFNLLDFFGIEAEG